MYTQSVLESYRCVLNYSLCAVYFKMKIKCVNLRANAVNMFSYLSDTNVFWANIIHCDRSSSMYDLPKHLRFSFVHILCTVQTVQSSNLKRKIWSIPSDLIACNPLLLRQLDTFFLSHRNRTLFHTCVSHYRFNID